MLPRVLSLISGCVWAGIAWFLLDQRINPAITAGILISPLIGITVGSFSRHFGERRPSMRAAVALFTLYFAAALFGSIGGIVDFAFGTGSQDILSAILASVFFVSWGLTFTGYFLILWPLAYINHSLISRAWLIASRQC
jgi:hypothetical protein